MYSKNCDLVVTAHWFTKSLEDVGKLNAPFVVQRMRQMRSTKNLSLATNSNFLILISSQPDGVNL